MKIRPKLLIIEEKEMQLAFLEDFGYEVAFLYRDNCLFSLLNSCKFKPDLLIINLPSSFVLGSNLLDFLRKHKSFAYTFIIIISDLKDKKEELFSLRNGADDFIAKPFDVDILLARIDGFLRRASWNKECFVDIASLPFLVVPKDISALTVRESTILNLISKGASNDEIAINLCLSGLTVKTHVKNLFKKLGVSNRTEAILVGINFGLIV